ncbi:hypothetical protein [Consotaella aegiceratis]|uniref:hypothetical protein n=1 Tax=Consotaella aegiceratis TaxID=3097961 RepID=UPI002F3F5962
MEQFAAFMLLVGCSGNGAVCTEIPVPVVAYESVETCQADLPVQIRMSGSDADHIYGACKAVDPEVFQQSATVEWEISRDGHLMVSVESEPQIVASR